MKRGHTSFAPRRRDSPEHALTNAYTPSEELYALMTGLDF